jgi:GT2 family glycosyltransferase
MEAFEHAATTRSALFVAVSYFGSADLRELVTSLIEGSRSSWRLVVVDNSLDGRESERISSLCSHDGRISAITPASNLGYYGGARLALSEQGIPPAWTVVCNTDLAFASDFVERLCSAPPEVVLAPSVRSLRTGRDQNPYLARRPGRWKARQWRWEFATVPVAKLVVALGNIPSRRWSRRRVQCDQAQQIYAPHGSCIAFPASFFERGGSLLHPPFLFGEEISVGEQCRRIGMSVTYEPSLRVFHAEHRATGVWRSTRMVRWQQEAVRYATDLLDRGIEAR